MPDWIAKDWLIKVMALIGAIAMCVSHRSGCFM